MKHLLYLLILLFSTCLYAQESTDTASPDATAKIYQKALEAMARYQFEDALKLLSECYIREQDNIDYINPIAYCHTKLGRYPDAKMYYQQTIKFDSINITAISSLSEIYELERNYKRALPYRQQLIQLDSTNSFYYKKLAYLHSRLGDMYSGIRAFLKAHQLNARDIEVIQQLSDIYLRTDNLEYAEDMLRKGMYTDPNNIRLLQIKARLHKKRSEHEGVIDAVNRTMAQGDTTNYYQMILGVAYLYVDSLDQAVFHLNAMVERAEDTEHTHHYLGVAYHQMDSLDRSVAHFEQAIEKGISRKVGIYYADLGSIAEERKQYKDAIARYEKAYEYSNDPELLFHLAHNYDLYYKDKSIALRYYEKYRATEHAKYSKYTIDRIEKLKEIIHFQR